MLFNSATYIFVFVPLVAAGYFTLNHFTRYRLAAIFLAIASLVFYSIEGFDFLPVLLLSIVANYAMGTALTISPETMEGPRKTLLTVGIMFNLGMLAYFKYTNFFLDNVDALLGTDWKIEKVAFPLALSFVTFQKIAYLVDSYRSLTRGYGAVNYGLFVTFFPQLIAGPIVHHADLVPQFKNKERRQFNFENASLGLMIFSAGLFKKVVLADTFSQWSTPGFDAATNLTSLQAWITGLSFTFQLYFDFSGYVDMAIGSALIFNIHLPINFNSPYSSTNIQDFWRRWHMTLSRFLRDYLYIPLGGNRRGELRTYANLFATFLLGGLWHGASWMFVIWGALHGAGLVIHRVWNRSGLPLPRPVAWLVTFVFVVITWVFFRATNMESAMKILTGMANFQDGSMQALYQQIREQPFILRDYLSMDSQLFSLTWLSAAFIIVLVFPTSMRLFKGKQRKVPYALYAGALFAAALLPLLSLQESPSEFLYFNF
ncbi:MBOAT family O-acyltransferase [Rhizobium hidalgonense]|uniref:MBOAT family O-acyltransferase n=1 Tax=Rhizobium hidalgonense TaxID=1538159 RepID=UPI002871DD25|nr:MBOAT family protein [Rhizobium hidalgonense]MDR9809560.1 MBOAT family protein [Rhizobium hidalgonense]